MSFEDSSSFFPNPLNRDGAAGVVLAGADEAAGVSGFFCAPNRLPAAGVLPEDEPSTGLLGGAEKKLENAGVVDEGCAVAVQGV